MLYNCDCIECSKKYLEDGSIPLLVCDPPFGIEEVGFGKHYNRDEEYAVDGYVEAPADYYGFTRDWVTEAFRILSPDGSMYIISGWTNADIIGSVLRELKIPVINKIIWRFNFGVFTKKKFVTSHYEIFYVCKNPKKRTFNTYCRYGFQAKKDGKSLLYKDLESVWDINKEYQPKQKKNKNKLPEELVHKMILYSSNEGDKVCDFFLGNFTTAIVAKKLNRVPVGFELNKLAFDIGIGVLDSIVVGSDIVEVENELPEHQGKKIDQHTIDRICTDYTEMRSGGENHKNAVAWLAENYGRGIFSISNIVNKHCRYCARSKPEIVDMFKESENN
jgi:site-specific DNA-methyltransferase (adenine-specific)